MPTDYTGLDRVLKAMNAADFSALAIKRKKNQLWFIEGEKEDLIERFNEWAEDYIEPGRNDFEALTMELTKGVKSKEPITFTFSFSPSNFERLAMGTANNNAKPSENLYIEYGKMISENAILKAEQTILKSKISDLERDIEDLEKELDENPGNEDIMNGFLKEGLNHFKLVNRPQASMNGVDNSITEAVEGLSKLDANFKVHLNKLYFLAQNDTEAYKGAINMLNEMVSTE